jgi:GMP synthase-like glutamine amidotransferase
MRALILQFEATNPPGHLGAHLSAHDNAWDVVRMDLPHASLSLDGYDALVALGGAMGANDAADFSFLDEATALLRAAVTRRTPCLGICLGGQLLARSLGAAVTRNAEKEVGRIAVTLAAGAGADPLLRGLDPVLDTVQFHQDTIAVPEGGVLLASSELCATQIVRCAERAYALQFHPEAPWQDFARWVEHAYRDFVGPEKAARGPAIVEDVRAHDAAIRAYANGLFDNFVRLASPAHASA